MELNNVRTSQGGTPLQEAPLRQAMEDSAAVAQGQSGAGASAENQQTIALGKCYEVACVCCAACGLSSNLTSISQGHVGVVTEFGRYVRTLPPGRHRFNVMSEQVFPVSLKVVCLDIPPQSVMTKDNLTVAIDAVCYYQVFDAQKAVFNIDNYPFALANLAQVTLRTVLGEHTLAEIFAERQRINLRLKALIDDASDAWGIQVGRVELKGIGIDEKMQRAMAAKAEANQEAEAKIIQAVAQRDAAAILAEAAEKMAGQPTALKLQWFETLRIITTQGKNTTIIVPDGMDSSMALAAMAQSTKQPR